jgi:hypothetical protein
MKIEEIPFFLQTLKDEVIPEKIDEQLPFMLEVINDLLVKIKLSNDLQAANYYFDTLQEIQYVLAIIAFVKEIPITKELGKFLSDCDRLDVVWTRDMLFKMIKADAYHLETGVSLFREGFDDHLLTKH